jgi:hypothetical protein
LSCKSGALRKTKQYLEDVTEKVKKGSAPLRDIEKVSVLAA